MVKDDQGAAADTSLEGREVIGGERNNRKVSVKAGKRQHGSNHGIKGKQQRDRREKRRSIGVVNLASTSGEEELSAADTVGTETKRNTAQNESIGDLAPSQQEAGEAGEARDLVTITGERKNSGRGPGHTSNSHNRQARLRSKTPARSEDMEADDELVSVKTDFG